MPSPHAQRALARLVRLIVRRHSGDVRPTDEAELRRLADALGGDAAGFHGICDEIIATLVAGWVWDPRRSGFYLPGGTPRRGRPRNPTFLQAWMLARTHLLAHHGYQPTHSMIADYMRTEPGLRALAGLGRITPIATIQRRYRRCRGDYSTF